MKARTDLVVAEPQEHAIVALSGSPQDVINKAIEMAKPLAKVVREAGLAIKIGDKEHVTVEGWNILGAMCGVLPQVEYSRKVSDDPIVYESRVILVNSAGRTIGAAEGMASSAECSYIDAKRKCPKCGKETLMFFREAKYGAYKGQKAYWCAPAKDGGADGGCNTNFAGNDERIASQVVGKVAIPATWTTSESSIRSMSQTRTIGKAYRTVLAWVMKMAGFEPTPAEEMPNLAVESEAHVVADEKPSAAAPPPAAPTPQVEAPSGTRNTDEVAPETPASGASTKGDERNYAKEFRATMEAHYGMPFRANGNETAGAKLIRCCNAVADHYKLGFKVESFAGTTQDQWKALAESAAKYVAQKAAESGTEPAGTDPAPQSQRWQDNTPPDADAEYDAAAAAAANASTEEEAAAADQRLANAKRLAKSQGQAAAFGTPAALVSACEKAARKFAKTRPDKVYLQQAGAITYFVDGDVLDACGMSSLTGLDIDGLTADQRATLRRAVEAEVEAM